MGVALTRESIRDGHLQRMMTEAGFGAQLLSQAALDASRDALLAQLPPGGDVWVFGYGSLIWNPAIHYVERRIARVRGFHRRFCLWTSLGRGTPEQPGLLLGLERGGSCRGVALRIAADAVVEELTILWRREMLTGAYAPRLVNAVTEQGPVRAVAFVINHTYSRYAGRLEDAAVAEVVAKARGPVGDCAEYLFNTVAHLDELGIHDRHLHHLCDAVRQRRAEAR